MQDFVIMNDRLKARYPEGFATFAHKHHYASLADDPAIVGAEGSSVRVIFLDSTELLKPGSIQQIAAIAAESPLVLVGPVNTAANVSEGLLQGQLTYVSNHCSEAVLSAVCDEVSRLHQQSS
jgi:hypothetical protein